MVSSHVQGIYSILVKQTERRNSVAISWFSSIGGGGVRLHEGYHVKVALNQFSFTYRANQDCKT